MKIAVCFSGMLRCGAETIPSIRNFIGDLWSQCDFFIHTWDIDYYNVLTGETLEHFNKVNTIDTDLSKLNLMNSQYRFKSMLVENYFGTVEDVSKRYSDTVTHPNWFVPWYYSWHKSILLKKEYEESNNFVYDYVIKIRTDVIFRPDLRLIDYLNMVEPNTVGSNMIYHDFYTDTHLAEDVIMIASSPTMDSISTAWQGRVAGDNQNKEVYQYLYSYIKQVGVTPLDLELYYMGDHYKIGLYRDVSSIFDPLTEFDKCVECDRTHYHVLSKNDFKHIKQDDVSKMVAHTLGLRKSLPNSLK
jgi:hypothetical protein